MRHLRTGLRWGATVAVVAATGALGLGGPAAYAQAPGGAGATSPGSTEALTACHLFVSRQSQFSDQAAVTVAKASRDAHAAASNSSRWRPLADALAQTVSIPATGITPAQAATANQDVATIDAICESLGVPTGSSAAPRPFSGTAFPNDQAAYDYLVGQGLTNYEAAGIVGNFDQESGDSPTSCQVAGCGSGGEGIAQWTVGGRWNVDANNNMVWYAGQLPGSPSPTTLQPQLQFTWYELATFPSYGLASIKSSGSLDNAVVAFQNDFEACNPTYCYTSTRETYAQDVLTAYGSTPPPSQVPVDAVADPGGDGYWELSSTGAVYSYGSSRYYGGANGQSYFAGQTAVAMAPANGGTGYWILSDTGAIYSYGSAVYHGGANGQTVVGLTANPAGTGYWIMLKNGGVYSEGVPYEGSAYDQSYFAGQTAVGIAASAGGTGYWILSNTGAIYSYGTAGYHGGANGQVVSGITADPAGTGYWIILTNGGVYSENAPYEGSAYDQSYFAGETAVSLADAPSGTGYWIMSDTGAIYSYNAPYEGGGI
jgi:hypothetical protein